MDNNTSPYLWDGMQGLTLRRHISAVASNGTWANRLLNIGESDRILIKS